MIFGDLGGVWLNFRKINTLFTKKNLFFFDYNISILNSREKINEQAKNTEMEKY